MIQTHLYYYARNGAYGSVRCEAGYQLAKGLTRISLKEYRANRTPAHALPATFAAMQSVEHAAPLTPREMQEQQRGWRLWKAFKWA